ncbi:MAG: mechanosensitive ion channel family protein [Fusobacteriota bacterium]
MNYYIYTGILFFGFSVIFLLVNFLIKRAKKLKLQKRKGMEQAKKRKLKLEYRFTIIKNIIFFILICIVILLATMPYLGELPSMVISLLISAVTIIFGIAARPFVENLISGIVISFSQLLRIGDMISIDDQFGTIEDIKLTHTVIKKWNLRLYIVSNSKMLSKEFCNYSLKKNQLISVLFWVDYKADMDLVEEIANKSVLESDFFLKSVKPFFYISNMDREGVQCMIAGSLKPGKNLWRAENKLRNLIYRSLQDNNIYPHMKYHDIIKKEIETF